MKPRRSAEDLKAIAHPVRIQVLRCVYGGVNSPVKVHAHLVREDSALSLSQVAYHFAVLADIGMIAPSKAERVHGAVEHFYKMTARGKRLVEVVGEL